MTSSNPNPPGVEALRSLIGERIRTFPYLPAFVSQVIDLLNDPQADIQKIAGMIKFDPGMTANILRLANSVQFGAQRSVRSLQEAMVRMGMKQLFQLVVAFGLGRRLNTALAGYELQPKELLDHSLWTALVAEEFCHILHIHAPDMLFTAGLLHDLGKLVMDEMIQTEKARLVPMVREEKRSFDDIERDLFGCDHAEVGARILDAWNFPDELVAVARFHHRPDDAGEYKKIASIVHLAEILGYAEGIGAGIDGLSYRLSEAAIANLGIRKPDLELAASRSLDRMRELDQILNAQGGG